MRLTKEDFLNSDGRLASTQQVAKDLLGKRLVRSLISEPSGGQPSTLSGIIVEVEAYLASRDTASHSHRGRSKKNASMFAAPGTLYVYSIHARHCLNVVTEPAGYGAAVLIRAIEPCDGTELMALNRKINDCPSNPQELRALTSGPGRLCEALAVDRHLDGIDLFASDQLWLEDSSMPAPKMKRRRRVTSRIGISTAKEKRLRWFLDGNRFVSGKASHHSQGRHWSFGE